MHDSARPHAARVCKQFQQTTWTGGKSATGLTHRDRKPFTPTFTQGYMLGYIFFPSWQLCVFGLVWFGSFLFVLGGGVVTQYSFSSSEDIHRYFILYWCKTNDYTKTRNINKKK